MATSEFDHYPNCGHRDPDNCSGCALTDLRQAVPNYSAWPLAYMENRRTVPIKWRKAFAREFTQTRNIPYAENCARHLEKYGVHLENIGHLPPGATVKDLLLALGEK